MSLLSEVFVRAIQMMANDPYYSCRTIDKAAWSLHSHIDSTDDLQVSARKLYWELCTANARQRRYHHSESCEAQANQDVPHFWNSTEYAMYKHERIEMLYLARLSAERMEEIYARENNIPLNTWRPL